MTQATMAELMAALPGILAAPKDDAPIQSLCFRPDYGLRQFPERLPLSVKGGIPGERWSKAPWLKLEDGSPDPRIQVSILPVRVMDLVWRDREGTPHPGDTIVADLDCGLANLPVDSLIAAGSAVLRVSDQFVQRGLRQVEGALWRRCQGLHRPAGPSGPAAARNSLFD
jgi:hypothetical protein